MKLYADTPVHRTRQILGDVLLVAWIALWVKLALVVHDATLRLATPGEQLADSASGMARSLRDAGDKVGGVPLVGDDIRAPFQGAGDAADRIAAAGTAQAEAVAQLAFWLALALALIPIALALAAFVPVRVAFVRDATAGQRFVDSSADLDLFALRAMAHQPLHRLATVSDDPVRAWRDANSSVLRDLAALELRDHGLRLPAPRASR